MLLLRRVLERRARTSALVAAGLGLFAYAVWPWTPMAREARTPRTIVFYGFSILGEAINKGVFPEFQRQWKKSHRERVEIVSSFAGSGTITNQVILGVPAHLALLSLELDADKLADAKVLTAGSWKKFPFEGVVNRTPFVILVRPGNPKGIHDFEDLARPGVRIVHPDPLTSGGANWAIIAEYGAGARHSPDPAAGGHAMLLGVWKNVVTQAASARAARTQFENGFGDALVTYEQDAIFDLSREKLEAELVYPRSTVLSEHTLVRVDRNISRREKDLVDAFSTFLFSEDAQRIFVRYGFRSVLEPLNDANPRFGKIEDPFRIGDVGGWKSAKKEIVEAVWKNRVLEEIKK
ncbi:MAG TPA: substrate-binding domain-containing protein [Thermoanaerobaculia bacterium]|nr:substrate-binding domain-containing protein [Thermoanaerobaculia bacterium]